MKNVFSFILLAGVFAFTSCGDNSTTTEDTNTTEMNEPVAPLDTEVYEDTTTTGRDTVTLN